MNDESECDSCLSPSIPGRVDHWEVKKAETIFVLAMTLTMTACSQQPDSSIEMNILKRRAENAHRYALAQNDYTDSLQSYNEHRSKTAAGDEPSLYPEYKALLAKYTAAITFFTDVNPGDVDPHLPLVANPDGVVTAKMIEADYAIMAHDYLEVLNHTKTGWNYSFPADLPPLPPLPSSDEEARKLVTLENTLKQTKQTTLATAPSLPQLSGFGWSNGSGPLHTHPGQLGQTIGVWCQVDAGGELVPCN